MTGSSWDLLAFAGIMALGQFSPGPDMLLLTRTALAEGTRAGVSTALGIATGLTIHAALAVAGLAVALEKAPVLRYVMVWGAAIYLVWLAIKLLKAAFRKFDGGGDPPAAKGNPYLRGLWCNLLNPKAILFFAAVCMPFLRGEHPVWWPAALWGIVVVQGGVLWALWAILLQWGPLRRGYKRSQRVIDGLFGAGLALLAMKLVLG